MFLTFSPVGCLSVQIMLFLYSDVKKMMMVVGYKCVEVRIMVVMMVENIG